MKPYSRSTRMGAVPTTVIVALATVSLCAVRGHAAPWVTSGPNGGPLRALAVAASTPTTLYVSSSDLTLYRSTDAGATWLRADAGLPEFAVNDIAVDPTDANRVFAATVIGLYRSDDGGAAWVRVAATAGAQVLRVAFAPNDPTTLYLTTPNEFFRSVDGGTSFSLAMDGLDSGRLNTIAVDAAVPGRIYVGASPQLFRSDDGADSWTELAVRDSPEDVTAVAIDPSDSSVLYAGLINDGVFKSTDGGGTWTEINDGIEDQGIRAIAIAPGTPFFVAAGTETGLFVSADAGESWQRAAMEPVSPIRRLRPGVSGRQIFVAADGPGFYANGTSDAIFRPRNAGIEQLLVRDVLFDPSRPGDIFAASFGGIFRSRDGGRSWEPSSGSLIFSRVAALSFDPDEARRAVAGSIDAGAFLSLDSATNWTPLAALDFPRITDVAADAAAADLWYASTEGGGVYVSRDDAQSWEVAAGSLISDDGRAIAIDATASGVAYVATSTGVLATDDAGRTWTERNQGLPATGAQDVGVDGEDPARLLAATADGIFRSTDRGLSWSQVNSGLPAEASFHSVATSIDRPQLWYAGGVGSVFRSSDGGATWDEIGSDLPAVPILEIAFHPSIPTRVLVATAGRGVWTAGQVCGDAVLDAGEACDDGNTSDGDECPATCGVMATCPGDCDGDGSVTVDEIVRGVSLALGNDEAGACDAMDRDASGTITVDEIITAVVNALDGCPT